MILDQLSHIGQYSGLSENFMKAISFLQSTDVYALPLGTFEIDDRNVYGFVKETKLTKENMRWEAHKKYADIQLILGGAERMGYIPYISQPEEDPYNEEKDIIFFSEPDFGTEFTLHPGTFAIFLPGELHRPDCPVSGSYIARKMVIKVRIQE